MGQLKRQFLFWGAIATTTAVLPGLALADIVSPDHGGGRHGRGDHGRGDHGRVTGTATPSWPSPVGRSARARPTPTACRSGAAAGSSPPTPAGWSASATRAQTRHGRPGRRDHLPLQGLGRRRLGDRHHHPERQARRQGRQGQGQGATRRRPRCPARLVRRRFPPRPRPTTTAPPCSTSWPPGKPTRTQPSRSPPKHGGRDGKGERGKRKGERGRGAAASWPARTSPSPSPSAGEPQKFSTPTIGDKGTLAACSGGGDTVDVTRGGFKVREAGADDAKKGDDKGKDKDRGDRKGRRGWWRR